MKRVLMASMAVLALSASGALASKGAHIIATEGERLNEAPHDMVAAGTLYNNRELREMGLKSEDLISVTTFREVPLGTYSPRDLRPEGRAGYDERVTEEETDVTDPPAS